PASCSRSTCAWPPASPCREEVAALRLDDDRAHHPQMYRAVIPERARGAEGHRTGHAAGRGVAAVEATAGRPALPASTIGVAGVVGLVPPPVLYRGVHG